MYSFSILEPVCCSKSSSNCCFLTCIQAFQEAGHVVWYSHLLQNFPQFIVIHTVEGFGIVNKAEIDVFLEPSCFFDDPADVGYSDTKARQKHYKKRNNRPIFLMKIESKIFNKVLADQSQLHIKGILQHNQVRFIPGMQRWLNIQKFISVMHHVKRKKKSTLSSQLMKKKHLSKFNTHS